MLDEKKRILWKDVLWIAGFSLVVAFASVAMVDYFWPWS